MKETKTTIVNYADYADPEFKAPSRYYIKNAMGDYMFIHTRTRNEAQEWLNETHGKGFYTVRSYGISKQDKEITAR
jgi:hypothetical protein